MGVSAPLRRARVLRVVGALRRRQRVLVLLRRLFPGEVRREVKATGGCVSGSRLARYKMLILTTMCEPPLETRVADPPPSSIPRAVSTQGYLTYKKTQPPLGPL